MLGLFYRDLINLKQSIKTTIFTIVITSIVLVYLDYGMCVVIALPFLLAYISIGTMQIDAALKWKKLINIMPIQQKVFVLNKYLLYSLLIFVGLLLGIVFGVVYMQATNYVLTNDHFTLMKGIALAITFPCGFGAFFLPCVFYFKGEKMELAMILCMTIMFAIIGVGAIIIKTITLDFVYTDLDFFIYTLMGSSIVLYVISYFVSKQIVKK